SAVRPTRGQVTAGRATGSPASDKRVVRRFFAALDAGDFDTLRRLLAPDFEAHFVRPRFTLGRVRFLLTLYALQEAFPDARFELLDVDASDETVETRWVATGTFEKPFAGLDPTGDVVTLPGRAAFRVVDGRIEELRIRPDLLTLIAEVGLGVLT
ncbi:ester cyclase, partial [Halorussus sp. GCM10023401]